MNKHGKVRVVLRYNTELGLFDLYVPIDVHKVLVKHLKSNRLEVVLRLVTELWEQECPYKFDCEYCCEFDADRWKNCEILRWMGK